MKILQDSPYLFDAGQIKQDFFKSIMPNNVGISKCNYSKCPWSKRRIFNEQVLGTKSFNSMFYCIPNIISKSINSPPTNIVNFKNISYIIT